MAGFIAMMSILGACLVTGVLLRKMKFQRDTQNDIFAGVCSGLAKSCKI